MELNLDPRKTPSNSTKFNSKEHFHKLALENYNSTVQSTNLDEAIAFPINALADQLFEALKAPGVKQYMYVNPETLELVISPTTVSHLLYILVYHPDNLETTSWLVTNMLRKNSVKYFRSNGVLYVTK